MLSFALLMLVAEVHLLVPPGDRVAADAAKHAARQLERPVLVETATRALDPRLVLQSCSPPISASIDAEGGALNVVRCEDGMVLSRYFDPRSSSAYAIAIAVVELIDLAERPPQPKQEPAPLVTPVLDRTAALGVVVIAGVALSVGPEQIAPLLSPRLGFDLVFQDFFALGVRTQLFASASSELPRGDRLEYLRHDFALRFGIDPRAAGWTAGVLMGVSNVLTTVAREDEIELGAGDRWPFFLGLGAELRQVIRPPIAIALGAELVWVLAPADYLVRGEVVTSDGDVRALGYLSVSWDLTR